MSSTSTSNGLRRHGGWRFARTRCSLTGMLTGMLLGAWATGGTGRYDEAEGFSGAVSGAYHTILKAVRYTTASVQDSSSQTPSSVRNLGLGQQIETRLYQDKRVEARDIVVNVESDGTAVLRGVVPDTAHKDKAVALARDTRGVERVVDYLAVSPQPRVIETRGAYPEPEPAATSIATRPRALR